MTVVKLLYLSSVFANQVNQPDLRYEDCIVNSKFYDHPEIENVRELKIAHQRDDNETLRACLRKADLEQYENQLVEN